AVVVEVGDRAIRTGRDAGELGAGAALRLLEGDAGRLEHGVAAVLGEDLAEVGLPRPTHRDHRLDVLQGAALGADVAADHPHHLLVALVPVDEAYRLEAEPLLPALPR